MEFGKRIELTDPKVDRKEFTHLLERSMEEVCDHQMKDISTGELGEYKILFKQHLKWYRRIEQRLKSIDLPDVSGM